MNEQGSCYKCLCELFNIFWCFRVENWYDNSVSINSIFIDKIDNPNSNIDNYRLLTPNSFIEFYRISKKLIDFYRLLSNVIDYRYYRITLLGNLQPSFIAEFVLKSWEGVNWDVRHSTDTPLILKGPKLGRGGGGYFQKNWVGVCGRLPKTLYTYLPYFRPKSVIFPTLFQTWPLNQSACDKLLWHVHGWQKH